MFFGMFCVLWCFEPENHPGGMPSQDLNEKALPPIPIQELGAGGTNKLRSKNLLKKYLTPSKNHDGRLLPLEKEPKKSSKLPSVVSMYYCRYPQKTCLDPPASQATPSRCTSGFSPRLSGWGGRLRGLLRLAYPRLAAVLSGFALQFFFFRWSDLLKGRLKGGHWIFKRLFKEIQVCKCLKFFQKPFEEVFVACLFSFTYYPARLRRLFDVSHLPEDLFLK